MLMLCSRFGHASRFAFGGYGAGSGSSGLLGSFSYTLVTTQFGVDPRRVLSFVSLAPIIANIGYHFLLPSPYSSTANISRNSSSTTGHAILDLPLASKLRIYRGLAIPFMGPIAVNFFLDAILTQGILPTLLFSLPLISPFLSHLIITPPDFYRVYITTSLCFSFLGRISINLRPIRPVGKPQSLVLYYAIITVELACLIAQTGESFSLAGKGTELYGVWGVLMFVALQGILTGLVFCNIYWDVGKRDLPRSVYKAVTEGQARQRVLRAEVKKGSEEEMEDEMAGLLAELGEEEEEDWDEAKEVQLREFALSTIAPADILSMLAGGAVAMTVQMWVCKGREAGGCTSA